MAELKNLPWLNIRVIALCMTINMLDGFDILAMAYAAPSVASEWNLNPGQLGALFSVGLGGMMAGSIFIGPLADKFGRRPIILACLLAAAASMALAASSVSLQALTVARFLTGLAIGGTLPCINTMAAEYSTARTRTIAVALTQAGFPIGATLGGFLSVWLLANFGWQSIFWAGAVIAILLLPIILLGMPESRALARSVASPLETRQLSTNGPNDTATKSEPSKKHTLGTLAHLRAALAILSLSFFASVMSYYFLTSWLPKILSDQGMNQGDAVLSGALLTSGGIVAALVLGWLAIKGPLVRIVSIAAAIAGCLTFLFGRIGGDEQTILFVAFVLGVVANGTQIGLYAVVPSIFPAHARASGTGLAIGLGRGGAVFAPWLAGILLLRGWETPDLFALMALPYFAVAILVLVLAKWQRY